MEVPKGFLSYLCYFIFFLPVFVFLSVLGIIKGAIFSPFVFLVIAFGDTGVIIGLWPLHLVWTIYCIISTMDSGWSCWKCDYGYRIWLLLACPGDI
nr:putative membrane protein [Quercus suber]